MNTIDKSAGQTLKDFEKMMKELKPYLPSPTRIIEPKPIPYQLPKTTPKRRREY